MIPETNLIIEKYVLGELKGKELDDFYLQLKNSDEFALEVKTSQEIFNSILEQDVMDLRSNLREICLKEQSKPTTQAFFDFAQNLSTLSNQNAFSDDISTTENSLQQIHFETHLKCITERVHQINSRTDQSQEAILSNQINDFIFEEEIKEAVLENDILELRDNLKEIISQGYINFSDFEIDQYRSGELSPEQMNEIGNLVENNRIMNNQLRLHEEIDVAINENDILSLRNSLAEIIDEEQQISFAEIKRIDDYLLEYLNEKERSEFESLLEEDIKLKNETALHSEINEAITETEIMKLRNTLSEIIDENKSTSKIRKLIPDNIKNRPLRYVGVAASAAAVITAGFFTLSQQETTSDSLFQQAYKPYEATGLFRSVPLSNPSFQGVDLYNNRKYDAAIAQFDIVLKENSEHPMCNFYTGLCYLEKKNYDKAINAFQMVISEKDNLFIEQAEWYMALSMLKTNDEKNAYAILNRIVEYKGYYQKNAKELLNKLK